MCVDDDPEIGKSLRLLFEDDFHVLTFTEPKNAIKELETNKKVSVIISDHRMPEMNGLQFLMKVKELYPEFRTYNIIYSGYSEVEAEMDNMIKAKVIDEFLTKSCPTRLLTAAVTNGIMRAKSRFAS